MLHVSLYRRYAFRTIRHTLEEIIRLEYILILSLYISYSVGLSKRTKYKTYVNRMPFLRRGLSFEKALHLFMVGLTLKLGFHIGTLMLKLCLTRT